MKPVIGMILSLGLITLAAEIPAAFKDPGLEQNIRKEQLVLSGRRRSISLSRV